MLPLINFLAQFSKSFPSDYQILSFVLSYRPTKLFAKYFIGNTNKYKRNPLDQQLFLNNEGMIEVTARSFNFF
jgi:hypothetical protein